MSDKKERKKRNTGKYFLAIKRVPWKPRTELQQLAWGDAVENWPWPRLFIPCTRNSCDAQGERTSPNWYSIRPLEESIICKYSNLTKTWSQRQDYFHFIFILFIFFSLHFILCYNVWFVSLTLAVTFSATVIHSFVHCVLVWIVYFSISLPLLAPFVHCTRALVLVRSIADTPPWYQINKQSIKHIL